MSWKAWTGIASGAVIAALAAWIYVANWWAFVDNHQIGYRFNALTGEITILDRTGWHPKNPFTEFIGTVDTRPMQVCINANSRVLNCKLVKFNPAGIKTFLNWHGRSWADKSDLDEILKSYAFDGSGKSYDFLEILRELNPNDVPSKAAPAAQTPVPLQ